MKATRAPATSTHGRTVCRSVRGKAIVQERAHYIEKKKKDEKHGAAFLFFGGVQFIIIRVFNSFPS